MSQFKRLKLWVRRLAPAPLVHLLRPLPYFALEWFQPRLQVDGVPIPPLWKMYEGPRSKRLFLNNSQQALDIYEKYGHIQRDSHVLDIGSGLGRKTFCLIELLSRKGQYVGLDVDREAVDYLNKLISPEHPQFKFIHVDLYNGLYNRSGSVNPSEFMFPFSDENFDLVVAWSVFTHMLPADVIHYLEETSRLLRPGGICIFSFFIMTPSAREAVITKRAEERIIFEEGGYFTNNKNIPEDVIAYTRDWVLTTYRRAGLIIDHILPGSWVGDGETREFSVLNYQDIVVGRKPAASHQA